MLDVLADRVTEVLDGKADEDGAGEEEEEEEEMEEGMVKEYEYGENIGGRQALIGSSRGSAGVTGGPVRDCSNYP